MRPAEQPSYRLYIDESGDLGLGSKPGGSEWFVLSGLVSPFPDAQALNTLADALFVLFGKDPTFVFHYHRLPHEERVALATHLRASPGLRALSVAIHKPSLTNPELYRLENRLYYLALRLLLENIPRLVHGYESRLTGNGTVEAILSFRGGLTRLGTQHLVATLLNEAPSADPDTGTPILRADQFHLNQARNQFGLQFADAIATGTRLALEPNRFGHTEDRYLRELLPVFYRWGGEVIGHGLRLYPEDARPATWGALRETLARL